MCVKVCKYYIYTIYILCIYIHIYTYIYIYWVKLWCHHPWVSTSWPKRPVSAGPAGVSGIRGGQPAGAAGGTHGAPSSLPPQTVALLKRCWCNVPAILNWYIMVYYLLIVFNCQLPCIIVNIKRRLCLKMWVSLCHPYHGLRTGAAARYLDFIINYIYL